MNQPRERIYSALFLLGSGLTWTDPNGSQKFQQTGRRLLDWSQVPSGQQPALFQREQIERADQQQAFGLPRWKLTVEWWIYLQIASDEATIPSQFINPLLDALDALFVVPRGQQQLASVNNNVPLVTNVWIDGMILMDDPIYPDAQAVIRVPISVITGA